MRRPVRKTATKRVKKTALKRTARGPGRPARKIAVKKVVRRKRVA